MGKFLSVIPFLPLILHGTQLNLGPFLFAFFSTFLTYFFTVAPHLRNLPYFLHIPTVIAGHSVNTRHCLPLPTFYCRFTVSSLGKFCTLRPLISPGTFGQELGKSYTSFRCRLHAAPLSYVTSLIKATSRHRIAPDYSVRTVIARPQAGTARLRLRLRAIHWCICYWVPPRDDDASHDSSSSGVR